MILGNSVKVIVHRGTHQIGGCCAEIATDTTRILVDYGANVEADNSSRMVSMSSPSAVPVSMFCSSKYTLMPKFFSSRTVSKRVTVFRAKRETDFVSTLSIFPLRQSARSRWKFSLPSSVPVFASSA